MERKPNIETSRQAKTAMHSECRDREGIVDRKALVSRHTIEWNDPAGRLMLGNGEFCFGVDGTGVQTFAGNCMSHWGWHSFPLPAGWTHDRVPSTGTFQKGRCTGEDIFPPGTETIRQWMFDNPHILNLGRLRLVRGDGAQVTPADVGTVGRTLNLWTGLHTTRYRIGGQPVTVETCVHPKLDLVAVRIESPLVVHGGLDAALDFPYPTIEEGPWVGDFSRTEGHSCVYHSSGDRRVDCIRTVDATTYHVALEAGAGCIVRQPSAAGGACTVSAGKGAVLSFVCGFSATPLPDTLPSVGTTAEACARKWEAFWNSGGAIDLSASTDPRWKELERRIVLSQYQLAAQTAVLGIVRGVLSRPGL